MANNLSGWVSTFSNTEIPILHKSKARLHQLQVDERDITVTVLTEIARQDPGLSIHLLRHTGRSVKREITTLSHAISLISIPIVIKMISDLPELEKVQNGNSISRILNNYARQFQIAFIARKWSLLRSESENNEIFTAGLNRGFVRFLMYIIEPEKAIKLEEIYETPDLDHKLKEKELLGNSVDELAQAIAKEWNLPELIRESYSGKHHNPKITGIRLATELVHYIYSQSSLHYSDDLINRIAGYIHTNNDLTAGNINSSIINAIRNSQQYLPFQPLLTMLMSHPVSIRQKKPNKKTVNKSEKETLLECIKLLRANNIDRPVAGLIKIALKAMHEGIGFSRVVFMTYNAGEKCLKMSMQSNTKSLPSLSNLNISIELNKLFNQLLKKEQTLCINAKNQHKYSELLPKALRPMQATATIITNSFYVNKKLIGCFFVDHGQSDKQLSAKEQHLFQSICTELKAAIESTLVKNRTTKKVA